LQSIPVYVHGTGEQSRDFTYVRNVVEANLLVMNSDLDNGSSKVFNVGTGNNISINELLKNINDLLKMKDSTIIHINERKNDRLHSKACVAGIKKELGYYPKWDLKNGLEETIEYFHSQLHTHSV